MTVSASISQIVDETLKFLYTRLSGCAEKVVKRKERNTAFFSKWE